jgi:superoxide dismutase, Cu-Zn family
MRRFAAVLVVGLLLGACEREQDAPPMTETGAPGAPGADAAPPAGGAGTDGVTPTAPGNGVAVELMDRNGQRVGGARLEEDAQGVRVSLRVQGLSGTHGVHFHQNGQCDGPDFQSAGPHFAPRGRQHGFENPQGPHAGDLPNVTANAQGVVDTTFVATNVRLTADAPEGLLRDGGTSIIVHANADDYRTDPSGNSGDRIACGVIRRGS